MKLLNIFKNAIAGTNKNPPEQLHSQENIKPPQIKKCNFPGRLNGHPIQYAYAIDFTPLDGIDIIRDILNGEERIVQVSADGDTIRLLYNDKEFGYIQDKSKAQMVSDWKLKGFPCHAILLSSASKVNLRFYMDKRVGNENREQTVVSLAAYKSAKKQEIIEFLENGDELLLEENDDKEDAVDVIAEFDKIGSLPKKIAVKYLNEGAFGAFYEYGEESDDGIIVPHIRIYW